MRREVRFNENGILISKRYTMQKISKDSTRFLKVDRFYFFNSKPFYVMNGKGLIDYYHLPVSKPKFDLIDIKNLEYYLRNKTHKSLDYDEQMQIENFVKIANFNEIHREPRLYTKEFKEIEKELYGIKENEFIVVQRY